MSVGHGGAEEQHLPVLREAVEDAGDLLVEALVQHLVGFVEHRVLAALELQVLAADVVEHAAGGADDDRRALSSASSCCFIDAPP